MDAWLRGPVDTAMAGWLAASVVWELVNAGAWLHGESDNWMDGCKDALDACQLGCVGSVVNLWSGMLGRRGYMCLWTFQWVDEWMGGLLGLRGTSGNPWSRFRGPTGAADAWVN